MPLILFPNHKVAIVVENELIGEGVYEKVELFELFGPGQMEIHQSQRSPLFYKKIHFYNAEMYTY